MAQNMVIGLGGFGGRVVKEAARAWGDNRANCFFSVMDLSVSELRELSCETEERICCIPLFRNCRVRDLVEQYTGLGVRDWFPEDPALLARTLLEGTGGRIRPLARLAFLDAMETGRLIPWHDGLLRLLREAPPRSEMKITVVGSLAGTVGTGCFLQVALWLRRLLCGDFGLPQPKIEGIFLLPDAFEETINCFSDGTAQRTEMNALCGAALQELDAITRIRMGGEKPAFPMKLDGLFDSERDHGCGKPVYDKLILISGRNENGERAEALQSLERAARDRILSRLAGGAAAQGDAFALTFGNENRFRVNCGCFGTATAEYPAAQIEEYCALRAAEELLEKQLPFPSKGRDQEWIRDFESRSEAAAGLLAKAEEYIARLKEAVGEEARKLEKDFGAALSLPREWLQEKDGDLALWQNRVIQGERLLRDYLGFVEKSAGALAFRLADRICPRRREEQNPTEALSLQSYLGAADADCGRRPLPLNALHYLLLKLQEQLSEWKESDGTEQLFRAACREEDPVFDNPRSSKTEMTPSEYLGSRSFLQTLPRFLQGFRERYQSYYEKRLRCCRRFAEEQLLLQLSFLLADRVSARSEAAREVEQELLRLAQELPERLEHNDHSTRNSQTRLFVCGEREEKEAIYRRLHWDREELLQRSSRLLAELTEEAFFQRAVPEHPVARESGWAARELLSLCREGIREEGELPRSCTVDRALILRESLQEEFSRLSPALQKQRIREKTQELAQALSQRAVCLLEQEPEIGQLRRIAWEANPRFTPDAAVFPPVGSGFFIGPELEDTCLRCFWEGEGLSPEGVKALALAKACYGACRGREGGRIPLHLDRHWEKLF